MHTVVLGMAKSGTSVAHYLYKKGEKIILTDQKRIEQKEMWKKRNVQIVEGYHPIELLENCKQIIKNPGIPYQIPFLEEAKKRNIPILTEMEYAYLKLNIPIIAVTGSNGKTTITQLIYEILKEHGYNTITAGNIGLPLIETVEKELDIIVCECSSFQLMGTKTFKPFISVFSNLTPSHLDYHTDMDEYRNAKLRIQHNQQKNDWLIFHHSLQHLQSEMNPSVQKIIYGVEKMDEPDHKKTINIQDNVIYMEGKRVISIDEISLKGKHNLENILAAIETTKIMGVSHTSIRNVLKTFKGVSYRLEKVYQFEDIDIYNDSKSTNSESAITALKSMDKMTHWITGGKDRGETFENIIPYLTNIKNMYVYGETRDIIEKIAKKNNINVYSVENLEKAVEVCTQKIKQKETVLFSPACASWDQYENFEIRGKEFNQLIEKYKTNMK